MGTGRRTRGEKGSGKTCVVEFPAEIREISKQVNAERKAANLGKMPISVILEAMILEGKEQNWRAHIEEIHTRKTALQIGRGRPATRSGEPA